ncbi:moody [Carabus blaptoides fortunei]
MDEETYEFTRSLENDRWSRPMLTFAAVVTVAIIIVGVVGNVLTVVAFIRDRKLRSVAAAFITSLCVSDLLFCLTVLPFAVSRFVHGDWVHNDILCSVVPMLRYGNVGVSLLSIAMISVNRYLLIAWPQFYPKVYTKCKVAIFVILCWVISYGLMIPTSLGVWGKFGYDDKLHTCSITEDEHGNSSKSTFFSVGFALPCGIIVVCYTRIYWVVRKSHERLQKHGCGVDTKRSEWHITRMVLAIFLCFLVCYLPITIVKVFDDDGNYPALHITGYLLLYMSSCVNPVIYVTMNKQYRQSYLATLKCQFSDQHSIGAVQEPSKTGVSAVYLQKNSKVVMSPA